MRSSTKAALVGGAVFLAGWIGWGRHSGNNVETVPYDRVRTIDSVEIRRYPQVVLAETTAPNEITAFRRLFRYIAGANRGDVEIPMTAPVETQSGESMSMTTPVRSESDAASEEVRMAFYLPTEYDHETAPEPTDPTVALVTEPAKTVAVDSFSWYAPKWRIERRERRLLDALERDGIRPFGEPYLLRYDDPWTPPFMRHNEVAVVVEGA
ncbi:SOUL heme-binding protein [Salinarchaeum sp. Harcht-Bsk1]|uniref:SOUL family heme-binding protein n=1 Tax=Salinarchaeum sp. Harcht-Bsk1 TaxID=1333523 RepID=UPI00034245F4|nr:heme-binding protein [Salinarchaeum sp. Harcht-Bsk1]AGN00085.1 SOUL heme-binding protein [Salinarchaeum sp. Harcht-Bsk1]